MSPTIFLIALVMSFNSHDFLNGRTVCGDPRIDLARYMAYPTFFLVLPIIFSSRINSWIDRRLAMLSDRAVGPQAFYAAFRCLGALWLSLFFLLPILLSCCRFVEPWFYTHGLLDGVRALFFFYTLGLLPAATVEGVLLVVGRGLVLDSASGLEQLSEQSSAAAEAKWRFRDVLLPYNLGAIAFWLLSSLLAVSVSAVFGISFQNPVTTKLSTFAYSTMPLVLVLLLTGVFTLVLKTWQKPLRAIALGVAVVVVQLQAPLHFLDDFGTVCQRWKR